MLDIDGAAYDPQDGLTYIINPDLEMWSYDPDTGTCTAETPSGSNLYSPPVNSTEAGTFGRFRWVPSENVFVYVNDVDQNAFVYRPNSGAAAATTLTTFTLEAGSTGSVVYKTAVELAEGATSAGAVSADIANSQATVMATWPDGSPRIVAIAGTTSLTADTPLVVDVINQAGASGTDLTTSDLTTAIGALGETSIQFGAYGTIDLADLTGSPETFGSPDPR